MSVHEFVDSILSFTREQCSVVSGLMCLFCCWFILQVCAVSCPHSAYFMREYGSVVR